MRVSHVNQAHVTQICTILKAVYHVCIIFITQFVKRQILKTKALPQGMTIALHIEPNCVGVGPIFSLRTGTDRGFETQCFVFNAE